MDFVRELLGMKFSSEVTEKVPRHKKRQRAKPKPIEGEYLIVIITPLSQLVSNFQEVCVICADQPAGFEPQKGQEYWFGSLKGS
jgi:hypothetical protein